MTTDTSHRSGRRCLIASTALAAILVAGGPLVLNDLNMPELAAPAYAESCCFTAETLVLLVDGSARPISDIQVGDVVLSGDGAPNTVTGIERVPLGDRHLYAINDMAPFFTREHPFLTAGGWRSVSPLASFTETPALRVRTFAEGDLLVGVSCGPALVGATALAPMVNRQFLRLVRLASATASAELEVYNLLLNGDHTYVANGFIVHNKGGEGGGGDGGGSGGEGGDSDGGGDSGGEGGGSGGEGGDSDGGGDSGGEGGDSGGEGGDSDGEGDSGGEGGDSSGEGGDSDGEGDSGGEGGEGGDSGGEGGESGSGEGGEGGSGEGGEGGFEGSAEPAGPDLNPDEEREMISRGWE